MRNSRIGEALRAFLPETARQMAIYKTWGWETVVPLLFKLLCRP